MLHAQTTRLSITAALALTASATWAAPVPIDVANPINGLTGIFSGSFDGALIPCAPGGPYCAFFGGDPTTARVVTASPNPSLVNNNVPGGIGPLGIPVALVPAAGSFLDLTLSGGNTQLTLNTSSISFGSVTICIATANSCAQLSAHAVNPGMVFNAPQPLVALPLTKVDGGSTGTTNVAVDANGKAVFMVQLSPTIIVDFSRFSQVVDVCTDAGGIIGVCGLVTTDVLNLDMVRYVLEIDYDPTFTSFTGRFIGQTGNSSMVFATLNSAGADQDGDGDIDTADNCPSNANADQANGDGDASGNVCDNCSATMNTLAGVVPNSPGLLKSQLDADVDGVGSRCDGDFNQTGIATNVNTTDYTILRSVINKTYNFSYTQPAGFNSAKADLNGSGTVDTTDYTIFRTLINKVPGPSGLACAGTIPCPPAPMP